METRRRDLSIPMDRANLIVAFLSIPVMVLQSLLFVWLHGIEGLNPAWNKLLLIVAVIAGVVVHEFLHGIGWVIGSRKPFSAVKFGFQRNTLTPYAHLTESVEVNAYRFGAFLPGFILGILAFIFSILFGNGDLFWFSLIHTSAAGGDWLILWIIRHVKAGSLVEDHPTHAGCYVLET